MVKDERLLLVHVDSNTNTIISERVLEECTQNFITYKYKIFPCGDDILINKYVTSLSHPLTIEILKYNIPNNELTRNKLKEWATNINYLTTFNNDIYAAITNCGICKYNPIKRKFDIMARFKGGFQDYCATSAGIYAFNRTNGTGYACEPCDSLFYNFLTKKLNTIKPIEFDTRGAIKINDENILLFASTGFALYNTVEDSYTFETNYTPIIGYRQIIHHDDTLYIIGSYRSYFLNKPFKGLPWHDLIFKYSSLKDQLTNDVRITVKKLLQERGFL